MKNITQLLYFFHCKIENINYVLSILHFDKDDILLPKEAVLTGERSI